MPNYVLQRTPGTYYVSTNYRGPAPLNTALGGRDGTWGDSVTPENFRSSLDVVRSTLASEPGFNEAGDSDFVSLFQFQYTPCCIPLPVLVWVNPVSEGVFVRVVFPATGTPADALRLVEVLNRINWSMPVGAFAAELGTGEVRFKSTLFFGDRPLDVKLFAHLLASTGEMVKSHHHAVVRAITGVEHVH